MKHSLKLLALAVLLCSCTTTSVEKTWKSPNYQGGPVQKVAVLAVSDAWMVRPALESRFARDIRQRGQAVVATGDLRGLPDVKADQAAATARLRQEGADSILIVRLVDRATYDRQVQTTPAAFVPVATGFDSYSWYGYYEVAFADMGATYTSTRDYLVLDSSLFDLNTGKRIWSVATQTVVTGDADRLVLADELVAKVTAQLFKDGMIR